MDLVRGANDREAFGCLYDRYEHRAFRVARSVCLNPARAEEAVQEAFLSIWRARARFECRQGENSFGAWLMTIVRRAAIDAVRHDRARPRLVAERPVTGDSRTSSPEDQAIARETGEGLRATLARLPEAQAEVIQLAFFGELSHSEIARQLDLPPGTVKGRMRLGLKKLRTGMTRPGPSR